MAQQMTTRALLLASGLSLGYVAGRSSAPTADEQTRRAVDAAAGCVKRFDELAAATVQCARIVGVKPAGNRRRELPGVEEEAGVVCGGTLAEGAGGQ